MTGSLADWLTCEEKAVKMLPRMRKAMPMIVLECLSETKGKPRKPSYQVKTELM